MDKLKAKFPRNYNIEKKYQKEYNELKSKNELFKDKKNNDIFLVAMTLGFKHKTFKPLKDSYPIVNTEGFDNKGVWLIATTAIGEKGLGVLNDMAEIRKIAEGYANGGYEILKKKLSSDKPGSLI